MTENYKDFTIEIEQDDIDESPREWDNLGTMVCFHGRYELGDKTEYREEDQNSWEELAMRLKKDGAIIVMPLYLYDHSGLRIKVGSFAGLLPQGHAEFDSGCVGFIYVTAEKLRKEYNVKRITKSIFNKAKKVLEGEVSTYDQYLSGDVYRFDITDADGENVDSLGGIYGYDEALEEAKSVIDGEIETRTKEHERKLKAQIKNRVPLYYR